MKQKIAAENWEILIQNERDMNIACTKFTKAFLDISELCIPKREVTKFTKAFLDISELCIPKREVTIRSNDSILRKEIRKRDRLRKKYILLKNDSSKEMYKRERNLVNNKKKQAK